MAKEGKFTMRHSKRNMLGGSVPVWLVILIFVMLGVPGIYAAMTISEIQYVAIYGEVFTITGELTVTSNGVDAAKADKSASGLNPDDPVTLRSGGPGGRAHTDITKWDWTYSIDVSVATVSPETKYKVTLYKDGEVVASLYVKQGADPDIGDRATLTWDIGASLDSSSFKVEIVTYT